MLVWIKIKIRFIVIHTHEICPPLLTHPGWHTHAQGHTHIETDAIHWTGGQLFTASGEHGGMGVPRRWTATPPAVSFTNLFEWRDSNRQPSGYWTTHSNHWATAAPLIKWININNPVPVTTQLMLTDTTGLVGFLSYKAIKQEKKSRVTANSVSGYCHT